MNNLIHYLDAPARPFRTAIEPIGEPGPGEIRLRTLRTSICQSDVVIWSQGLPRIKTWPAIILHEASCIVDATGEGVQNFSAGDIVGLGCDIPCGDPDCPYCGESGTGDWTCCPNTQATGHEFPGFARSHAILPAWFVQRGPIYRFGQATKNPDLADAACHLEPLACTLEGMTRVTDCIERRIVVLIGSGSQSVYALQSALAMGARKIIIVNRGTERLARVLSDFDPSRPDSSAELPPDPARDTYRSADGRLVGLLWTSDIVNRIRAECAPFAAPHYVMVNASAETAYRLGLELMGSGTVLDAHAGVKGASGKPRILHEVDLNRDIHYRLQCYQATHGSSMRGINLAGSLIAGGKLPLLCRMTRQNERFHHHRLDEAITAATRPDSLKVIVQWD